MHKKVLILVTPTCESDRYLPLLLLGSESAPPRGSADFYLIIHQLNITNYEGIYGDLGKAIPGVWTYPQREVDHGGGSSCCLRRSLHLSQSAAMMTDTLIRIGIAICIVVVIVLLESIAMVFAKFMIETSKDYIEKKKNERINNSLK